MMEKLRARMEAKCGERMTDPSSGLAKAIENLLQHWRPLTSFLRRAGAPLYNIVEGALKRAVLKRKRSLFCRTLNGTQVGDLFIHQIHSCQLCGPNSFDYLTELQCGTRELAANSAEWIPWSYRATLAEQSLVSGQHPLRARRVGWLVAIGRNSRASIPIPIPTSTSLLE